VSTVELPALGLPAVSKLETHRSHNAFREFEARAISADGRKKQRFGNPEGIVSFSPGLLARWDKLNWLIDSGLLNLNIPPGEKRATLG